MRTDGSANTVAAIEIDMRDLLRAKKAGLSDVSKESGDDYASLVSAISVLSFGEEAVCRSLSRCWSCRRASLTVAACRR